MPGETISGMENPVWSVVSKWWGFMSCAFWTFLALWILLKNPSASTQVAAYFALAGFSLLCALLLTILRLHKEVERLNALPPEIEIAIEDVVMHRTGDEEWRWKNGEFLVQVSAELFNLPSVTVEYSAQLVWPCP